MATRSVVRRVVLALRVVGAPALLAVLPVALVVGAASRAHGEPSPGRPRASIRRAELATHALSAGRSERPDAMRAERARAAADWARPTVDPAVARRVFATRLRPAGGSVIERGSTWVDVPDPEPRKPFRPKILPTVMGFPTGGGGVKLKFRY